MSGPFRNHLVTGLCTLTLLAGAVGCASLTETVEISVDANLQRIAAEPEGRSYAWLFYNQASADAFQPHVARMDAVLAERGYVLSPYRDAAIVLNVRVETDRLVRERRELTAAESGVPMNPDSIRYKNVAAMIGNGRYNELLNDDPNAPGDIILGPNGEIIATGNLRKPVDPGARPEGEVVRRISSLSIHAVVTEAAASAPPKHVDGPSEAKWYIDLRASAAADESAEPISRLVDLAIERLQRSP